MGLVNVFMGIRKDSHYMCVCVCKGKKRYIYGFY